MSSGVALVRKGIGLIYLRCGSVSEILMKQAYTFGSWNGASWNTGAA